MNYYVKWSQYQPYGINLFTKSSLVMPMHLVKYIINKNATILFWDDGTKTISKRHNEDIFDKELGFLFAYFYKRWGGSKNSLKRIISSIDENKIKVFLIEFFMKDNSATIEQAKKYLKNLKIEENN